MDVGIIMDKELTKKSFISKLFIKIAFLLTTITLVIGFSIYQYAYAIMAEEVAHFSQAQLEQLSDTIGDVVTDGIYLSERIAYNQQFINAIQQEQPLTEIVESIIEDHMWLKNQHHKRLFMVYVFKENELVYRNDQVQHPIFLEDLQANDLDKDVRVSNTMIDKEATGIYQHVFRVTQVIRDHLTGEELGYVMLNVTEKVLYDCYGKWIDKMKNYFIVNKEGQIISAKDKRIIGKNYKVLLLEETLEKSAIEGWVTYSANNNEYSILHNRIPGTEWYLIEELDLKMAIGPLNNIKIFIGISMLLFSILIIYILKEAAVELLGPVYHIKNQMKEVTRGNLESYIKESRADEFGNISQSFNEMLDQINGLVEEVKQTEQKKRLAELDFLRAQINPHFIYNTLSSIRFFIEMEKNKEAEEMLFYFSKILRATLSNSNQFIKIKDELITINHYVGLQQLRYAGSFEVVYAIDEEIMDYSIPNFILQPIIENSIFYSVQKEGEVSTILITGQMKENWIELQIIDSGIGMSEEKINQILHKGQGMNSIGIKNVHERIQLIYGEKYGLEIMSEERKGVQVLFKLPIA